MGSQFGNLVSLRDLKEDMWSEIENLGLIFAKLDVRFENRIECVDGR
jgi:hypothetical protein